MTPAPSARARRAVSSPMPALPPITTTVCPGKSGSRAAGEASGCGAHRIVSLQSAVDGPAPTGLRAAAIFPRRAFSAET